jgi:hypothetical protein
MRRVLTERNFVVVLFVMVFITFFFAENDSKKIERLYTPENSAKLNPVASPTVEVFITSSEVITNPQELSH